MDEEIMQEEHKNIYIVEKRTLEKVWQEIKVSIFNVLFVLLKNEDENMMSNLIQLVLDYLQMLYFPFQFKIQNDWNAPSFIQPIFAFFNYLQFQNITNINITYIYFIIYNYILVVLILLLLFDIIYVSYSFHRKKFAMLWPLHLLRSVVRIFVRVLFIQISQNLMAIVMCFEDQFGNLQLNNFSYITCWKGYHILHAIVFLTANFVYAFIAIVVAMIYYENKMKTGNPFAKKDSKSEIAYIGNKILCQIFFGFLPMSMDWLIILIMMLGALWLYWAYNVESPYYNNIVGNTYRACSSVYFYSCLALFVSWMLKGMNFTGGIIAWLIGLPFIPFIIFSTQKSHIDTLLASQTKFKSGQQVKEHIQYVQLLILQYKTDKNAYMLINGYAEKHKETCLETDCPLKSAYLKRRRRNNINIADLNKKQQKQVNTNIISNNTTSASEEMEQMIISLLLVLDRLYVQGLKKFPKSCVLRLSYAFFLIEYMRNNSKALTQLMYADRFTKPSFEDQFLIFRYKKIINDNLEEIAEKGTDIVDVIALDNHISQCEVKYMQAAILYKEFWKELQEEQPSLVKLNSIGGRISSIVKETRDHFNQIQKLNANVQEMLFSFGAFLQNVLNEKSQARALIKRARRIKLENRLQSQQQQSQPSFDPEKQRLPHMVVSGRRKTFGKVRSVNHLFTMLFCFTKDDVHNASMSIILPSIYASFHDYFMMHFISRAKNSNFDASSSQKQNTCVEQPTHQCLCKNKSGFIFPVTMNVHVTNVQTVNQIVNIQNINANKNTNSSSELQFVATFQSDVTCIGYLYFIVDKKGNVLDLSASASADFNLPLEKVQDKRHPVKINSLLPEILKDEAFVAPRGQFDPKNRRILCRKLDNARYRAWAFTISFHTPESNVQLNESQNESQNPINDIDDAFKNDSSDSSQEQSNYYQVQVSGYALRLERLYDEEEDKDIENNDNDFDPSSNFKVTNNNNFEPFTPKSAKKKRKMHDDKAGSSHLQFQLQQMSDLQAQTKQLQPQYNSQYDILQQQYNSIYHPKMSVAEELQEIEQQQEDDKERLQLQFYNFDQNQINCSNNADPPFVLVSPSLKRRKSVVQHKQQHQQKRNYGEGIITRRLIQNRVSFINDNLEKLQREAMEEDYNWEQSLFRNSIYEKQVDKESLRTFELPKAQQLIRNLFQMPPANSKLTVFSYVSFLFLCGVLVLVSIQHVYSSGQADQCQHSVDYIQLLDQRLDVFNQQMARLTDLLLINAAQNQIKVLNMPQTKTTPNETDTRQGLRSAALEMIKLNQQIRLFNSIFNYNVANDTMTMSSDLLDLLGAADLSIFTLSNSKVYQFVDNFLNVANPKLAYITQQMYYSLYGQLTKTFTQLYLLFACIFVLSAVTFTLFFLLLSKLRTERENILFLFFEIPQKHITDLYSRCERFISTYVPIKDQLLGRDDQDQNEQQQEDLFDQDSKNNSLDQETDLRQKQNQKGQGIDAQQGGGGEHEADEEQCLILINQQYQNAIKEENSQNANSNNTNLNSAKNELRLEQKQWQMRRKIIQKQRKDRFRGQRFTLIYLFALLIVAQTYSLANLLLLNAFRSNTSSIFPQYFLDGQTVTNWQYALTIWKIMLVEPSFTFQQQLIAQHAYSLLSSFNKRDPALLTFQQAVVSMSTSSLETAYKVLHKGDACLLLSTTILQSLSLQSTLNDIVDQTDYQTVLNCQNTLNGHISIGFDSLNFHIFNELAETISEQQQQSIQLQTVQIQAQFFDINAAICNQLQGIIEAFMQVEHDYLIDNISTFKSYLILCLALYIAIALLVFLFWLLPRLSQMKIQMNRTIGMLSMIPFKVIKENVNIRKFIIHLMKNKNSNK